MTAPLHPADELAALRARITALRARHDLLRAHLIATDDASRSGLRHIARVETRLTDRIDPDRLPKVIRDDRTFYTTTETHRILLTPRPVRRTYSAASAAASGDAQSVRYPSSTGTQPLS